MVSQMLIGLLFAALISVVSSRLSLLTLSGSVAQFFLGWIFFGLGGWKWTVPVLVFYVSSILLSNLGRARKASLKHRIAKPGKRDMWQVLANGGFAGLLTILAVIFPSPHWYVAALGSLGAATADTWGTEVGVLSCRPPLLVATLKSAEPGSSGGVSLLGSVVGAFGGVFIALSGWFWIAPEPRASILLLVSLSSILGAFLDSFLGATCQIQFRCRVCGHLTERMGHCGVPTVHVRGWRCITNDTVNLLCTSAGGAVAGLLSVLGV